MTAELPQIIRKSKATPSSAEKKSKKIAPKKPKIDLETVEFASVFINPFYEAYFLTKDIIMLRDNSVHKKSIYVSKITGDDVALLKLPDSMREKLKMEPSETLKKNFEEIFVCPNQRLLVLSGEVSVLEGGKKTKKGGLKLARFISMGSDKPRVKRSYIEILSVGKILGGYQQLFEG